MRDGGRVCILLPLSSQHCLKDCSFLLSRVFLAEAHPGGAGGKCSLAPALRHCFLGPCLSAWLPRPLTHIRTHTYMSLLTIRRVDGPQEGHALLGLLPCAVALLGRRGQRAVPPGTLRVNTTVTAIMAITTVTVVFYAIGVPGDGPPRHRPVGASWPGRGASWLAAPPPTLPPGVSWGTLGPLGL